MSFRFDDYNKRFKIVNFRTLVVIFLGFLAIKRLGGHANDQIFVVIEIFTNRTLPVGMLSGANQD